MADPTPQETAVRLLINDPTGVVFNDDEVAAFLELEGGVVKLAAAQAIDTIADNEALVSKVIKDGDLSTDGAKVADSLRRRAAALRAQAATEQAVADDADGDGYFEIVDVVGTTGRPELTERPGGFLGGSWGW